MAMAINSISKKTISAFLKEQGMDPKKGLTSLTSAQYRELLSFSASKPSSKGHLPDRFSFDYHIDFVEGGFDVTMTGRHLSKNDVNSLALKRKIQYKESVKEAAEVFRLKNMNIMKKVVPLGKADIYYEFHNPVSRDPDNNGDTLKVFQDTFTILRLIEDDKRSVIGEPKKKEVINKTYMVKARIRTI